MSLDYLGINSHNTLSSQGNTEHSTPGKGLFTRDSANSSTQVRAVEWH